MEVAVVLIGVVSGDGGEGGACYSNASELQMVVWPITPHAYNGGSSLPQLRPVVVEHRRIWVLCTVGKVVKAYRTW
jgi:hypothetical protein